MVRLGDKSDHKLEPFIPLFQFQHGAIGSKGFSRRNKNKCNVSIPAWCDWENQIYSKSNPIQMRFNSSMVRLGVKSVRHIVLFQHDVSIPAWCDWELEAHSWALLPSLRFNSNMVRLGVSNTSDTPVLETSFNSSMVRLGAAAAQVGAVEVPFQFQHGAIGSAWYSQ